MPAAKSTNPVPALPYRPLLLVALAVGLGIVADRFGGAARVGGLYFWWIAGVLFVIACFALRHRRATRSLTGQEPTAGQLSTLTRFVSGPE